MLYIRNDVIKELVREDWKRIVRFLAEYENEFIQLTMQYSQKEYLRELSQMQSQLTQAQNRIAELDTIIK